MKKRWKILPHCEDATYRLQKELGIHPGLCRILTQRGITNFEEAKAYYRPQLSMLHNPWLMKDMHQAVERIEKAISKNEKILVFGDYDVDGTTAVSCLFLYLQAVYRNIDYYIPHRYREGYGVSQAGIDFASANCFSLIISLDCGIKSVDLVSYASEKNIDFIICDHHLPDQVLPAAVAILNPKQKGCKYPYKELCGCGVGLKLVQALNEKWKLPDDRWHRLLDLVAVSIAADIVPITGENRVLSFFGLQKVNCEPSPGLKALLHLSGKNGQISVTDLVFMVAPRINAAGRMDDARKAVDLFLESDYNQALAKASLLHADNYDRKEVDSSITEEALAILQNESTNKFSTVVYKEHWHKGVVGIVASRLIENCYRPTVVLTKSGEYAAGSARSVPGFNLYEAIHACRKHLLSYGGHFAAAGLTLKINSIAAFSEAFEKEVASTIRPEQLVPEIVIDTMILFKDISEVFYDIICQMEPFGPQNMRPVFITKKVQETGYSRILKEKHIKFVWIQDNISFTGIGFNMADKFSLLRKSEFYDIVFSLDMNEWNNRKTLQLRMVDFRPSYMRPAEY